MRREGADGECRRKGRRSKRQNAQQREVRRREASARLAYQPESALSTEEYPLHPHSITVHALRKTSRPGSATSTDMSLSSPPLT